VGKNSDEHFARVVVQKTEQRRVRAAIFEPAILAGAEQYYFGFRARVRGARDEWQRVALGELNHSDSAHLTDDLDFVYFFGVLLTAETVRRLFF
jgi:hypothetical protein